MFIVLIAILAVAVLSAWGAQTQGQTGKRRRC